MIALFVCIWLWAIHPVSARFEENTTRVLFIGNSYTYYHSIPQLFRSMAEHKYPDLNIKIKFIGHGGATLEQHWHEGLALDEIKSGRWDFVVLQEQSMLGEEIIEHGKRYVRSPDIFFTYARKFENAIRENGAEAVFYMTWARKEDPDQQKYLTYAYMNIAEETGNKIAPVGMVWDVLQTNSLFDLYESDGSHPSVYGAYTSALMLFSVVFDTDSIGMPGRLEGYEILRGGKISVTKKVLTDLSMKEALLIQEVVSDTYKKMKAFGGYLNIEKAISDKKTSTVTKAFSYMSDSRGQFIVLISIGAVIFIVKFGKNLFPK